MKSLITKLMSILVSAAMSANSNAMFQDDPLLAKVMSEFEYLPNEADGAIEWDVDAWLGRDLYKFWFKSSGEYAREEGNGGQQSNKVEIASIELVYSRAVYTTWDQQFGIRHDIKPDDGRARNWVSFGYIGTAPYFLDVDARVFVGEESSTQLLVEVEREIMLSQEWVLTPELDIVANGRTNQDFDEGSGLSQIEFSLRLGYEHEGNRKFQPFFGITSKHSFGGTRRFAKSRGDKSSEVHIMFGVHSWF